MGTALVIVDIQKDYFPGGRMPLEGSPEAAERARRVLDAFRAAGRPVVHVRHESLRPGSTFFLPGTDGACIHPAVAPAPGEAVVVKHHPNAFRETDLLGRLRALGATRLVVCGMMTHMCVDATVRAACDLGFECVVAHDACATRALVFGESQVPAAHVHHAFLAALASAYARVVGSEQIVAEQSGREDV